VVDEKDACPDIFGEVALLGCPDRDKDTIADIFDKCPDIPGLKRYNGCPIPDTDGDGLNDEEDKCPGIAGKRELQGCPEVKQEVVKKVAMAAKSIYFMTGKDIIQKVSYPKLDTIASVLQSDADLHISIEGHTDNVGSVAVNEMLSNKRAQAVKNYLVNKGIEERRITATGFGSSKPVAPNSTPAGRAKNRRVELHLSY
jgi:outer membrane protein OmpA-like peptidoglycan-associated protein